MQVSNTDNVFLCLSWFSVYISPLSSTYLVSVMSFIWFGVNWQHNDHHTNTVTLKLTKAMCHTTDKSRTNSTARHVIQTENPFKNDNKKVMLRWSHHSSLLSSVSPFLFLLLVYRTGSKQTIHRRVTGEITKIRPFGSVAIYVRFPSSPSSAICNTSKYVLTNARVQANSVSCMFQAK